MPHSHRKKWIVGLCTGAILVAAAVAVWATRSHELLDHATRITEGSFTSYAWETPGKVLLLMPSSEGESQGYVERDVASGQQTLGTFEGSLRNVLGWRASPDGKRLLYADDNADFYAVGLRDSERHQRRFNSPDYTGSNTASHPGVAWLPDSRRWLAWSPQHTKEPLHLYSVDASRDAVIEIPAPPSMTTLLGVTPDLLVVQTDVPPPPTRTGKVTLATFGIYPNRAPVRSVSFSLPTTAEVKEVEMAQQGDRIAWLLYDSRRSPLVAILVRMLPSLAVRFPPTAGLSLWVSRRDGTGMREIGFEQTVVTGKNNNVPFDVRWNPDGKHLGFRMNDALYSVPAE